MTKVNYANRGMALEKIIDKTNKWYRTRRIADIRKVPTPIQITSYDKGKVTGFTKKGEWVDYVGIHDGRVIVFDAKEVNVDRFDLKNLEEHQFELLKSWFEKGAKAFLLVGFKKREEVYVLPFRLLDKYITNAESGGRKSIPYKEFSESCNRVLVRNGMLEYLQEI